MGFGGFPKLGVPFSGDPHNKDYSTWGSIFYNLIQGEHAPEFHTSPRLSWPSQGILRRCRTFGHLMLQIPNIPNYPTFSKLWELIVAYCSQEMRLSVSTIQRKALGAGASQGPGPRALVS